MRAEIGHLSEQPEKSVSIYRPKNPRDAKPEN